MSKLKFNESLCDQVREGRLAIENNASEKQIEELLEYIFPKDDFVVPEYKFFFCDPNNRNYHTGGDISNLPSRPVSDFFIQEEAEVEAKEQGSLSVVIQDLGKKYFPCTCGEIYLSRNLTAPDCQYHATCWQDALEEFASQQLQQPVVEYKALGVDSEIASIMSWVAIFYGSLEGLVNLKNYKDENGKDEHYLEENPKQWYAAKQAIQLWKKSDYGAKPLSTVVPDGWISVEEKPISGFYQVYDVNLFGSCKQEVMRYQSYNDTWYIGSDSYHPQFYRYLPNPPKQ